MSQGDGFHGREDLGAYERRVLASGRMYRFPDGSEELCLEPEVEIDIIRALVPHWRETIIDLGEADKLAAH